MIRWTKDGKVDRHATLGTICSGSLSPEQAERLSDIQDDLADALDVAVAALRELVALKDQKLLIDTQIAAANDGNYCRSVKEVRLEMDYKERKPKAWRAAREALRQMEPTMPNGKPCPFGDPLCPCQDGDMCHYEGTNPMKPPKPTMPKIELTDDDWQIISSTIPDDCIDVRIQAERGAIYRAGLAAGLERAARIGDARAEQCSRMTHPDEHIRRGAFAEYAAAIRALLKPPS